MVSLRLEVCVWFKPRFRISLKWIQFSVHFTYTVLLWSVWFFSPSIIRSFAFTVFAFFLSRQSDDVMCMKCWCCTIWFLIRLWLIILFQVMSSVLSNSFSLRLVSTTFAKCAVFRMLIKHDFLLFGFMHIEHKHTRTQNIRDVCVCL